MKNTVVIRHDVYRLGCKIDFGKLGRVGLCDVAGFGAMVERIAPYGLQKILSIVTPLKNGAQKPRSKQHFDKAS